MRDLAKLNELKKIYDRIPISKELPVDQVEDEVEIETN
jgi:hypothetical protein